MYLSMAEREKMLKPCPLCGTSPRINHVCTGLSAERVVIQCRGCGLTLDWSQEFTYSKGDRVATGPNFVDAWNRRTPDRCQREADHNPLIEKLAMTYAMDLVRYGVDVCAKWETATQQAAALEQAYIRGRKDELAKIEKWIEEKEVERWDP